MGAPLEVLTQDWSEPPAAGNQRQSRNVASSGFCLDQGDARDSSTAPGTSKAANELVEDRCPPQSLTVTTPLAPNCAPPYPDESRLSDLKEQITRARPGSADKIICCGRTRNAHVQYGRCLATKSG